MGTIKIYHDCRKIEFFYSIRSVFKKFYILFFACIDHFIMQVFSTSCMWLRYAKKDTTTLTVVKNSNFLTCLPVFQDLRVIVLGENQ
jgi:hypothetical protein